MWTLPAQTHNNQEIDLTIKVTIKNEDTRESPFIEVEVCSRAHQNDGLQLVNPTGQTKVLRAGESMEQWVHSHQDLHIREVSQ